MAISDPPFTIPAADGGPDDLPRTIRRERDAREREARERQAREARERRLSEAAGPAGFHVPAPAIMRAAGDGAVARLEIPFLHLMAFFLKAVFAAVPALAVLGLMVWTAAHLLLSWFPDLVKMQILILFPPN